MYLDAYVPNSYCADAVVEGAIANGVGIVGLPTQSGVAHTMYGAMTTYGAMGPYMSTDMIFNEEFSYRSIRVFRDARLSTLLEIPAYDPTLSKNLAPQSAISR